MHKGLRADVQNDSYGESSMNLARPTKTRCGEIRILAGRHVDKELEVVYIIFPSKGDLKKALLVATPPRITLSSLLRPSFKSKIALPLGW